MARIVVEAGIPSEVYEAAKNAGLSWSKVLTQALIEQLSFTNKEKERKITEDQQAVFNDAMVVLTGKLIAFERGDDAFKHPIEYAKVWCETLRSVGYFTTAQELIDAAKTKIAERKKN